jgi:hypothetical protein
MRSTIREGYRGESQAICSWIATKWVIAGSSSERSFRQPESTPHFGKIDQSPFRRIPATGLDRFADIYAIHDVLPCSVTRKVVDELQHSSFKVLHFRRRHNFHSNLLNGVSAGPHKPLTFPLLSAYGAARKPRKSFCDKTCGDERPTPRRFFEEPRKRRLRVPS